MAVWQRQATAVEGLIHHSDAGSQYTSVLYSERLATHGIAPSVGTVGRLLRQRHGRVAHRALQDRADPASRPVAEPSIRSRSQRSNTSTGSTTAGCTASHRSRTAHRSSRSCSTVHGPRSESKAESLYRTPGGSNTIGAVIDSRSRRPATTAYTTKTAATTAHPPTWFDPPSTSAVRPDATIHQGQRRGFGPRVLCPRRCRGSGQSGATRFLAGLATAKTSTRASLTATNQASDPPRS